MITTIFKLVQNKKAVKRFLAGMIAIILSLATILSDINVAYALTDTDTYSEEGDEVTNEASLDEMAEDAMPEEEAKEEEIPEPAAVEPEVTAEEITADEASIVELPIDEVKTDDGVDIISEETVILEDSDTNKESESMPPISIVKTVDDYEISLECDEGTFSEGTTVEVKKVDDEIKEETDRLVEDAIAENPVTENVDIVKIVTFDISFFDREGNVVEPAGKNSVSVNIVPSRQDKTELEEADALDDKNLLCSVFHIEDEDNVEEIECESTNPVEEVTFAAESFSAYSIVWYKGVLVDGTNQGPDKIGGYIKTTHKFIDFKLPLEFLNEGNPADTSLRPEELIFNIYGKDVTGGVGVDHDETLICTVTVPIENYYNSSKTVTLKKIGESFTEIPVYVEEGTQELVKNGDASYVMAGFEYRVEFVLDEGRTIYEVTQDSTGLDISAEINHTEWSAKGNQKLSAARQSLAPQKFYVSWIDNRNKAGERPYSTVDDFTSEETKKAFMDSITLYCKVGDGLVQKVTDSMLPTPMTLEKSGPVVGRKEGKSISDWEITYNNLPAVSDGKPIKYYITVNDDSFNDCYSLVIPEDSVDVTEDGKTKKAFLSGTTAKYIYAEYFTAKVEWYDAKNDHGVRLSADNLAKEFVISDDNGNTVFYGSAESNKYEVDWIYTDEKEIEWEFKVGPLPMYDEQGNEKSYNLVLKDGVIKADSVDHKYEYSVDYSNVPKTTAHENCLSDGKIILVIDRDLSSFKITKEWKDNDDYAAREEAVKAGVRFLLWRYPKTKTDGTKGTPADRAAVFNPETHIQYSYSISMNDVEAGHIKDSIEITLKEFGVTEDNPVDMYDQYGHEYVYFATEVISKSGYKTVYENFGVFAEYDEGVMNLGKMTNVRQEKMKMEGIVKWNVPAVNDYTKTTVTIELQRYDETNNTWTTLPIDEGKVYSKTLSGFTVTNPKNSHIFPEVDRYDEEGKEIKYRVIQTKVDYSGHEISLSYPASAPFDSDFEMNTKQYTAHAAPTPETSDSYTIENRLAGDIELILSKYWKDNGEKGFGKTGCEVYQNIEIKVFQHGVNSNYDVPYMTITTNGTSDRFKSHGDEETVSGNEVPCTITYHDSTSEAAKMIVKERYSDGRVKKWELKDTGDKNIFLPAFTDNDNGNAYSYTVEENHVEKAYTTYRYERKGNELSADITNAYAEGGGGVRTVVFQKEWIDGTDIPQEKPLRIAIVRIKENGEFYYEDGKIDLKDNLGDTHIITLTDNNNWYNQIDIDISGTRFDHTGEGLGKRYLYTAIELDMALNGTTDFSREVKYDDRDSIAAKLEADISGGTKCSEFSGSINAYLDESHEENHLPGYDVTVKAGNDTVINASKYIVVNKRKGIVNVVFNKTWHDGNNSEETRNGTYRVYLYQNGKKVVEEILDSDKEVSISGINSPNEVVYTSGTQEDSHEFRFDGLPQYDNDGNIYHYSVKEFLVKEGRELEIALTDTKDSTKTGYVVSDHSEDTHFTISGNTTLVRNDTYKYTNTITGEKTGGAKFYVLWHDQTSYDKGNRPDVNYVLYYRTKGSNHEPQVYNEEYKVEWHPMYDDNDEGNPLKTSRYYQYVNFTKLPLANDEGIPYEYFAVPSLNNPGDHYYEAYYKSNEAVIVARDDNNNIIKTSANKYHYDMGPGAEPLSDESKMLPENGIVEYTIYEFIHVEGNKIWRLADNGDVDPSKLPDAEIYLWRQNAHDNINANPGGTPLAETNLFPDKTGYAFKNAETGKYTEFQKYDKYGLTYTYSVSEKIYINSENPEYKYKYSIPNYVMNYKPETNGITNVYNPKDESGNLRKFTVTKDWAGLTDPISQKPVAEFRMYRVEVPLYDEHHNAFYTEEGPDTDKQLSANPKYDAYKYAIGKFTEYKKGSSDAIEIIGTKSVVYSAAGSDSFAVWDDMPIFSPNGLVYLYFVEELSEHHIESFDYDVIVEAEDSRPSRPSVRDISSANTQGSRENVLINEIPGKIDKVRAVLFSNYGLVPSQPKDYEDEETALRVNHQEAGYRNVFNNVKFGKIVGSKIWDDGSFKDYVRPKIVGDQCPEVILTLTRSAATQTGHKNQIGTETIDPSLYDIAWSEDPTDENKWKFELTPKDDTEEFKLYATNGRPYTYTVTESISGNTLANYTIVNGKVAGSERNVENDEMKLSSLQNKLKGQIKVFKKWDDAFNELNLRSQHVNVVLQYRLVKSSYAVGTYEGSDAVSKWTQYRNEEYTLTSVNKWGQTVGNLPVLAKIGDETYRYEYRLLETEFYDLKQTLHPIEIDEQGNARNAVKNVNVPNGGLCTDSSTEDARNTLYGNSTSPDEKYHNKSYEIKIGNYIVNNSAIASLANNKGNVSSMELRVDNRLAEKISLKIEKKWDGVNVGEATSAPIDRYGILPESLTFYIEKKGKDEADTEWEPLEDSAGKKVFVTIDRNKEDNSFVQTYTNLPRTGDFGKLLVYRAVETDINLERFKNTPHYDYDPALFDGQRTICHTTITNELDYRDITIKKKWNAEDELRKQVTVQLYSDNFTTSADPLQPEKSFQPVNNTETDLNAGNGWEVTYNNLPVWNTKNEKIRYYVMESKVDESPFDKDKYAIYFFAQTESDYSPVSERRDSKANIAPIPENAFKMYVVNTPKTSLKVSKTWNDEENRQNLRENVNVTLSNDDEVSVSPVTKTLKPADNSSVTWEYLPIYKKPDVDFVKGSMAHMGKVNYTITEASNLKEKGYEIPEYAFNNKKSITESGFTINLGSSNNNATITNTFHPHKISFMATKNWEDESNRHFSRPTLKGIYLTLYYSTNNKTWNKVENISSDNAGKNYPNGSHVYTLSNVTQHVENNDTDIWGTCVWEGLPTMVSKKAIYYKAFETDENGTIKISPGYTATHSPESIDVSSKISGDSVSQNIVNKLNLTSMRVSKEWIDTYDVSDRPDEVSFVLEYRCGEMDSFRIYKNPNGTVLRAKLTGEDHKPGTSNIWETKVDNLPSTNSEGIKYEYRVKEISISYGGEEVASHGVTAEDISHSIFTPVGDSWKSESTVGTFGNSVVSSPSTSGESSEYGYKVTAVNTPIVGKLTVVKKWDDECNRDNLRPHEIKLQLYRKQDQVNPVKYGEPVVVGPGRDGTTVNPNNNEWSYTFDNLPVFNNDSLELTEENKSVYYVMEVNPEHGYSVSYTPENGVTADNFDGADNILKNNSDGSYSTSEIITNKYTPVRIKISAKKVWIDNDDNQGVRPESLMFKLQYHIAGETAGWKDVSYVSSEAELDKSGKLVQTTSAVDKKLQHNISDPENIWEKDEHAEDVIWENLPAYVDNGKKVEYRLLEYDIAGTTDEQKISKRYRTIYDQCEYEAEYGSEYSLKATNILNDMGGILEVDKKWNPDYKDDIANNDKTIIKIQCHLEQKDRNSIFDNWEMPGEWAKFDLSHDNNWQYIFANNLTSLFAYRIVEDAIIYKDCETPIAASGKRIGSFMWDVTPAIIKGEGENAKMQATLTNTIPNNSITVSKTWEDENNRDGKRTHSVTVRLLRDGEPVGEPVILYPKDDTINSPWDEYTWKYLPVYKNGTLEQSVYTVEEVADEEFKKIYEIKYKVDDGENNATCENIVFNPTISDKNVKVSITNKHETHKETIKASKIWKDENDKFRTRPKKLLGDYHTYLMLIYKLEHQDNWERVNQYPDYSDFEKRGYQYPDHHIYTTSPVIQEVTGSADERWNEVAIWENVSTRGVDDVYSRDTNPDQNVLFRVIEVPGPDYEFPGVDNSAENPRSIAPAGYKAIDPQNPFDPENDHNIVEFAEITNTLITTELEVEKTWDDIENQFNTRPEKIRVKLERKLKDDETNPDKEWNSVKQTSKNDTEIELSAEGGWKGLFDNLPLYDQNGKKYIYRAVETALIYEGREVALNITDESDNGITLAAEGGNYISNMKNTSEDSEVDPESVKYKLSLENILNDNDGDTTTLTVKKKWRDENNRDSIRNDSITVNLLRDGVKVDTKIVNAPTWEYKWDKLPLYQNGYSGFGRKSVYTVTEDPVADYEAKIEESADKQYTIINTHVPKKAVITADKIWEDSNNAYSTRPKEIYLRLLYKYDGEGDSEYRIVPEYSKAEYEKEGMYPSEGVFTTSPVTQKCTGIDDENWANAARWENLPLTASPNRDEYALKPVIYKVIEVPSLTADSTINTSAGCTGYEVLDDSIDGRSLSTDKENNIKVTNRLITAEVNISKIFEDGGNKYDTRPDAIEVEVLRRIKSSSGDNEWKPVKVKGGLFGDDLFVTLIKAEAFSKKLTDMPKYDKDKNEYEYTCLEKTLIFGDKKIPLEKTNVTASYTVLGNDTKITNTLITTSLTVEKEWDDNSNKKGARPEKIVFLVEQKETKDIASQIISELIELFTGEDGYHELKAYKDGKLEPMEITIEGPDFNAYTLEGLPVYSKEGYLYSYRAIETKFIYADREVIIDKETSLYKKPVYQLDAIETGKDERGNTLYKYNEKVVNKIISPKKPPVTPPANEDSDLDIPEPVHPSIVPPGPVQPGPEQPPSKFEIIEDGDPEVLPKIVTDTIFELIDLPDNEFRQEQVEKLYNDLLKILEMDPVFIDRLDAETADIVRRFLESGVLGRRRSRLPKTGGVVGSIMALLFGAALIGLGIAIRPGDESEKKKRY